MIAYNDYINQSVLFFTQRLSESVRLVFPPLHGGPRSYPQLFLHRVYKLEKDSATSVAAHKFYLRMYGRRNRHFASFRSRRSSHSHIVPTDQVRGNDVSLRDFFGTEGCHLKFDAIVL